MKFAVMILMFNAEKFILRTIENCGPFVDKIFVGYSKVPWNAYNKNARIEFVNQSNVELLKESKFYNKLEIVEGIWDTDEGQRNAILKCARDQGFDYMIFQDADEFYLPEDFQKNLQAISNHPGYMLYQTPWINFWKNLNYVTVCREHNGEKNTIFSTCSAFAMNLKKNPETQLTFARIFPTNDIYQLSGICFHLSYVLSDKEVYAKINTWGHSHQVTKNWYKWKWLSWTEQTQNIHPLGPGEWVRAIKYEGELPKELHGFPVPEQVTIPLQWADKWRSAFFDTAAIMTNKLKKLVKG